MPDEVIKELWKIKDGIAQQYGYNAAALVAHLRAKKRTEGERISDLRKTRKTGGTIAPSDAPNPRH
jgi:hypothetical protein